MLKASNPVNARSDTAMNFHVSITHYHSRYTRFDTIWRVYRGRNPINEKFLWTSRL